MPGANDATVVGDSSAGIETGPSDVDQRVVEAAIRKGLITAIQGNRVLEQLADDSGSPQAGSETGALGSLVAKGFVSKEAAQELEDEVKSDFIPGYRLVGELGRGGMGVVYKAVQKRLDRTVALKVVNPNQAGDPGYLKRFRQEALALGKLNHPNIVQVYDYGEAHGKVFLALEFVEGKDGAGVLKDLKTFPEPLALRVIRDAALGLQHAHQAGIIHRDVKPANLMLLKGPKEGEWTTKVTDLGLARQQTKDGGGEMTKAGTILGSPAYMAPEQTHGELADFRSDIYALGATLYHLATGKVPFSAESAIKVIVKKQTELLEDPRTAVPDLSEQLVRVLDRMMAVPREERYPSYEALVADLEAMLAGRAPETPSVPRAASSFHPHKAAPTERARQAAERYTLGTKRFNRDRVAEGLPPAVEASAGEPAGTAPAAPGASTPASKAGPLVAGALLLALVGGAAATRGSLWGTTGGPPTTPTTPPTPTPPTTTPTDPSAAAEAGVTATLGALESLPAEERLDVATLEGALADLGKVEAEGKRRALRVRLVGLIGPALAEVEASRQAKLEGLLAQGEYAALGAAAPRVLAPYRLIEREVPTRLAALAEVARLASGEDGKAERALAEQLRAEADPERVVALTDELARRFPWSPALAAARERVAKLDVESPRVSVKLDPPTARLGVDGKPATAADGPRALRLGKGKHTLVAQADGCFDLQREVEVTGPLEVALRLNPRPARELTYHRSVEVYAWNPRAPLTSQWTIGGTVSADPGNSGIALEAAAGAWSTATRDIGTVMEKVKRPPGVLGWQLVWELVPPTGTGTAEMRLLGSSEGMAVCGVRANGELYVGLRRGAALEVLATRVLAPLPQPLRAEWDGKVLVVWAKDELVGSLVLPWAPAEACIEVAAQDGRAEFRGILLRPLIDARPQ